MGNFLSSTSGHTGYRGLKKSKKHQWSDKSYFLNSKASFYLFCDRIKTLAITEICAHGYTYINNVECEDHSVIQWPMANVIKHCIRIVYDCRVVLTSGQYYKAATIAIYVSRVINMSNLLVTTTLES